MSDDRFKQARRSLLDRQNQQQRDQGPNDTFGDEFEDEATALVDLNKVEQQASEQAGNHPPPPGMSDDKTEMMSLDELQRGAAQQRDQPRGDHPSLMIGDGGGLGQEQQPPEPANPHSNQPTAPSFDTGEGNVQSSSSFGAGSQSGPTQGGQGQGGQAHGGPSGAAPVVIGDTDDFEGSTQFINLSEFAEESGPQLTPDDHEAGYDGNTQFVNLAELQAGAAQLDQAGPTIENDSILKQGYQFSAESIQRGEFSLIFAQNAMGKPVILKQIWEGDSAQMPVEVRQRVAALDQIRHPRLVALNGMLASETGTWVELDRPPGYRLTDIVQQNGPQPKDNVMEWMRQVGEVLSTVHARGFAYANLTTDAVWVQEDGSVVLEPFDVLTFENRGNLGVFGPPELNMPPQQMVLSPATDVYSLACVMTAALTGLPLNLSAVQQLEKPLPEAITHAIQQDPGQRTPNVEAFFEEASGGSGGLPDIDIKIVIGAVALLGVLVVGGLYATQGSNQPAPAPGPGPAEPAEPAEPFQKPNGEPIAAVAEPPGEVFRHESINVKTSFVIKPETAVDDGSGLPDPSEVNPDELRIEAREEVDSAKGLVKKMQREKYRNALEKMTIAVRLSEMTEEDEAFISDLLDKDVVEEMRKETHERIDKAFQEDNLSSVKTLYPKLAGQELEVTDLRFFTDNKTVGVTKLRRDGAEPEPEEDK